MITFERKGSKVLITKFGKVYAVPNNVAIVPSGSDNINFIINADEHVGVKWNDIKGLVATNRNDAIAELIDSFFFSLVYDDESAPLLTQPAKNQNSAIQQNLEEGTMDIKTNAVVDEDYIVFVRQLSHKYKEGADIYPHLHVMVDAAGVPNLLISYRWYNNGEAPPAWTHLAHEELALTHELGKLNILKFPVMSKSDATISSNIDIRVQRDPNNSTGLFAGIDAYASDARVKYVDIHIPYDTAGSNEVYSK